MVYTNFVQCYVFRNLEVYFSAANVINDMMLVESKQVEPLNISSVMT